MTIIGILCILTPFIVAWLRYGKLDLETMDRFTFDMSLKDLFLMKAFMFSGFTLVTAAQLF